MIILFLTILAILLLAKLQDVEAKMIAKKEEKIQLFEHYKQQHLPQVHHVNSNQQSSHNQQNQQNPHNQCDIVKNHIKNNLGENGKCVFDYDNTLTNNNGQIANCAAAAVSACPSLAVNTYNSGATYDTCGTDPVFVNAGFCPNGKCKVPEKYWANRVGYNQHYLNNKYVGDVFMQGTKTRAMDMMGLDKENTMLIDDLQDNILHAKGAGYKTFHVSGGNGL